MLDVGSGLALITAYMAVESPFAAMFTGAGNELTAACNAWTCAEFAEALARSRASAVSLEDALAASLWA